MKKDFKNKIVPDNFYEKAWKARMGVMKKIIEEGESHPLRVVNIFESLSRFSGAKITEKGDIEYLLDLNYPVKEVSNLINLSGETTNVNFQLDLKGTLPNGLKESVIRAHKNGHYEASYYAFTDKISFLVDYLRNFKPQAVVELGSGFAQNLIKLFYSGGPKVPYYALEFTESGTSCAAMLANLTNEFNLIPASFDFNNPDFSILKEKERIFYFTCHSIEQVSVISEELFEKISQSAGEISCFHFEPFGFQLAINNIKSELDELQGNFFSSRGWNSNLAETLFKLHLNKKINLIYIGKNILGNEDPVNPTSLAVWNNKLPD